LWEAYLSFWLQLFSLFEYLIDFFCFKAPLVVFLARAYRNPSMGDTLRKNNAPLGFYLYFTAALKYFVDKFILLGISRRFFREYLAKEGSLWDPTAYLAYKHMFYGYICYIGLPFFSYSIPSFKKESFRARRRALKYSFLKLGIE
jgi:hypothetical protein